MLTARLRRRGVAREECVDLGIGGREQGLADDTRHDEISIARELDEERVAQHRMTVPRRCRAVISIPSGLVNLSRRSGPRATRNPRL